MAESTLKEKTAKGLFWGGISSSIQQILGLLLGLILARVLSPGDYGMVGVLAIFIGIANSLQESGFTAALINKQNVKDEDYNAVFWFSVLVSSIIYLILFFGAPLIASFYNKPELTNLSRFVFLSFLFGGFGTAHNAYLFKNLMIKERAKIDIFSLIISGVIGVFLALNDFAYWGLAVQSVMFVLMGTFLKWYYVKWRPNWNINLSPLSEMLNFSFKLFLTNILGQFSSNIFSVLLGKFYNEKQVGYFNQGNKWMLMGYSLIGGMITSIIQPTFVLLQDNMERQKNVLRKILRFIAFVSFPIMLGIAFIANEFILIFLTDKWSASIPILQILCIWGAFAPFVNCWIQVAVSHGRSNTYFTYSVFFNMFQIFVIVIMFPFGIMAMVKIYVVSYFLWFLMWYYCINSILKIEFWEILKDISPYLILTLLVFAIVFFSIYSISNLYLRLFIKIVSSLFLYLMVLYLLRSVIFREFISYIKKML